MIGPLHEPEWPELLKELFPDPTERHVVERVLDLMHRQGLDPQPHGAEIHLAFPGRWGFDEWLVISAPEHHVWVDFGRLTGHQPFIGAARAQLMRTLRQKGFVRDRSRYVSVKLSLLIDKDEWSKLEVALVLIIEVGLRKKAG